MNKTKRINAKLEKLLKVPYLKEPLYKSFYYRAEELLKDLNDKEFRVSIVGEFSAGKSTFLNALIGKDILPHAVNETTATVTYIKNVQSNHPLCNKMEVAFFGEQDNLIADLPKEPTGLVKYVTTMSKDIQVVNEISSVTIYVDFPYTDEPIVFIDTPGLNGVAEGHYERTRYEIQRAHTSIYLLHTRGLTQSNIEMYDLLRQYQSSFLFVINAIDSLKADEGETAETKLIELREQLAQIGVERNVELYGVSALMALAAKDERIDKLYDSDTEPLTSVRRQQLLGQSRFSQIEEAIWNRLLSSDKEAVRIDNIERKMDELIKDVLLEFEEQTAIFEVKVDEHRLQELDMRLQNAKISKDANLKNIESFIGAKASDVRSMLLKRVEADLKQLHKEIEDELASAFNRYVNKKATFKPEQIIEKVKDHVKGKLKDKEKAVGAAYPPIFSSLLQDIYESALIRLEKYYPKITIAQFQNNFDIQLEKAQIEDLSLKKKILQKKQEIRTVEDDSFAMNKKLVEQQQVVSTTHSELQNTEQSIAYTKKNEQNQVSRLGSRPSIRTRRVSYEVEVERRGGIFGRIVGKVAGPKYETRTREEKDSSERDRWDKEMASIKKRFETDRRTLQIKNDKLRSRLNDERYKLDSLSSQAARLQQHLENLEKDIDLLDREFEAIYEKNRMFYFNKQRREISSTLEQYIFNSLKSYYRQIIEKTLDKESAQILLMIRKEHDSSYNQYVHKLESFKKNLMNEAVPAERKEAEKRLREVVKTIG